MAEEKVEAGDRAGGLFSLTGLKVAFTALITVSNHKSTHSEAGPMSDARCQNAVTFIRRTGMRRPVEPSMQSVKLGGQSDLFRRQGR